ncbi:hypothetical protein PR048_007662 [Dryococelus australis]|uniref:Uncharacterized protein n=1 Tax=Dryococelus australis TaxID=614101 RepID=A0ABQ9HVT9_9NEOP|nr:hypothetical protein PR048_007662 [Dryococelus australis]
MFPIKLDEQRTRCKGTAVNTDDTTATMRTRNSKLPSATIGNCDPFPIGGTQSGGHLIHHSRDLLLVVTSTMYGRFHARLGSEKRYVLRVTKRNVTRTNCPLFESEGSRCGMWQLGEWRTSISYSPTNLSHKDFQSACQVMATPAGIRNAGTRDNVGCVPMAAAVGAYKLFLFEKDFKRLFKIPSSASTHSCFPMTDICIAMANVQKSPSSHEQLCLGRNGCRSKFSLTPCLNTVSVGACDRNRRRPIGPYHTGHYPVLYSIDYWPVINQWRTELILTHSNVLYPRSHPSKATRVQHPARSPDFREWESCRTMPLVGGFSRGSPVSPAPSFRRRFIYTSITLCISLDIPVYLPDTAPMSVY